MKEKEAMSKPIRWLLWALLASALVLSGGPARAQQGGVAVTVVCSQYLRSLPSEDAPRVGLMNPGDVFAVVGQNAGWLLLQIDPNFQGWAYDGDCLAVSGDLNTVPTINPTQVATPGLPVGTIVCPQYLRRYPSTDGLVLATLSAADSPLSIGGRNADNTWMLVTTLTGQVGWTSYTECIRVAGNFLTVPVVEPTEPYSGPPVLDVLCSQYVRAQPNTQAAHVAVMQPADDPWLITGRNADNSWFVVTNSDGGLVGWTAFGGECVNLLGDLNAVPVVSEPVYSGPAVANVVCSQYLRAYPSADGRRISVLDATSGVVQIVGRNQPATWLYVRADSGLEGWMANGNCLNVLGNVLETPILLPEATGAPQVVTEPVGAAGIAEPYATVSCNQYLRFEPDAEATAVATMRPGDAPYSILWRNADTSWLYLNGNGYQGWAAWGNCLNVVGEVLGLPIFSPGAYSGSPVVELACPQRLRAYPSMEGRILDVMPAGAGPYNIVGRTEDASWLFIQRYDGLQGWVGIGDCLRVSGDVLAAPVIGMAVYDGPPVGALTCTQYLRTVPAQNSQAVRVLDGSEGTLYIIGRTADLDWMQIMLSDGTVGWAATGACIGVRGNLTDAPVVEQPFPVYSGPPIGALTCTQFLRALPTEESQQVWVLTGLEGTLSITGRTPDNAWMRIALENGTVGWAASGACVMVRGNLDEAPVIPYPLLPTYGGPPIAMVSCPQFLREQPSVNSTAITTLQPEDGVLSILGRNEDTSWVFVERADGVQGWTAYGECLVTQGNVLGLPVQPTAAPYSGPPLADVICNVNLRRNPTHNAEVMTVLSAETGYLNVIERDDNGDWVLVELSNGMVGWLSLGDCVVTLGNVAAVPTPPLADRNPDLWTVIRAAGVCTSGDQAGQIISTFNRNAPIGAVSRQCTRSDQQAVTLLTRLQVEIAIVSGACPGFQQVPLSGGQTLCHRAVRTSQVDDFVNFARQQ